MELGNKLTVVATYSHDDRSAIVLLRRLDNTYIVGKNYERNGDEVSWCWGQIQDFHQYHHQHLSR